MSNKPQSQRTKLDKYRKDIKVRALKLLQDHPELRHNHTLPAIGRALATYTEPDDVALESLINTLKLKGLK